MTLTHIKKRKTSMIKRIFVEKKEGLRHSADKVKSDIEGVLGIRAEWVRVFLRYDVEGLEGEDFDRAVTSVFSAARG